MNQIPSDLLYLNGYSFRGSCGTPFEIKVVESDVSQLVLTDKGTSLDPGIPPSFHFEVYELGVIDNYRDLSGQFSKISDIEKYYDIDLTQNETLVSETVTDVFMKIPEIHGVFVDSILTDEADNLVFGSFWGRDTSIREFQGRLTLGKAEGGMSDFTVMGDDRHGELRKVFTRIPNIDSYEQMTGRVHTDILGDLVHCWLYQREVIKPDLVNHRAILISQNEHPVNLWAVIKAVCPVPLLDHWQDLLIPQMTHKGMIKHLYGINQSGVQMAIDEDVMALLVKEGCLNGTLSISDVRK
jgi:hypothetical protein